MEIEGSRHDPPEARDVPRYVDEMCDYVSDNWGTKSALHLAAYVMWRLNWIPPFVDGNGRTTRAVSYYVFCSKLDFYLPGVTTIPEFISRDKAPYYKALEAGDEGQEAGEIDVSDMEDLLKNLLAKQMVLALDRAESVAPEERPERSGTKQAMTLSQTRPSLSTGKTGGQQFSLKAAAAFGALALFFFMFLIGLAVMGYEVPERQRFLVVIVLALFGGLSAGFLGGNASARGSIPFQPAQEHPVKFALTGGVATLILLLIIGRALFL